MPDQELPFEPNGDGRIDVPGELIHMEVAGPGSEPGRIWVIGLHWRFPSGEHVVTSGASDTYEDALLDARRMLYVKHLSREARARLTG